MSLSDREQQALREIEMSLMADDPNFGHIDEGPALPGVALRSIALFALGLCMLVGGIAFVKTSQLFLILSAFGFLVMFAAGIWFVRGSSSTNRASAASTSKRRSGSAVKPAKTKKASSLEEDFYKRFNRD
ncbi:DUF3040 domain-containing protein [Corynebacterium argentoratense]|uniref:DUF3040 domain-containing protein n=1 Tax=Corynebacterium argentoratense TaxID=42817 RepID=UPI001F3949E4|nr:DUF3040 domain-containing protein [Corynebacterium argentoratense]MCF1765031.1 DUF3040 domain-containing protein [Corynebacterium argentoratense]